MRTMTAWQGWAALTLSALLIAPELSAQTRSFTPNPTASTGSVRTLAARDGDWVIVPRATTPGARRQFDSGSDFFPAARGTYNGLIAPGGDLVPERSGSFQISVSSGGSFSGRFNIAGNTFPIRGWFNQQGLAGVSIYRRVWDDCYCFQTLVHVWTVELDLIADSDEIEGLVTNERQGGWVADLYGLKAGYASTSEVAPQEGRYTVRLPGSDDAAVAPPGDGFGALTINGHGQAKISGSLPDGTRVTQSAYISTDGYWPLYQALNDGDGMLFGWLRVRNDDSVGGTLEWIKPFNAGRALYPAGFSGSIDVEGGPWSVPPGSLSPFTWTDGVFAAAAGNLSGIPANPVEFLLPNKVVIGSGDLIGLTIQVNARTGMMNGKFVRPDTGRKTSWSGAAFQFLDRAGGYFLGTTQGGVIELNPSSAR